MKLIIDLKADESERPGNPPDSPGSNQRNRLDSLHLWDNWPFPQYRSLLSDTSCDSPSHPRLCICSNAYSSRSYRACRYSIHLPESPPALSGIRRKSEAGSIVTWYKGGTEAYYRLDADFRDAQSFFCSSASICSCPRLFLFSGSTKPYQ